MFDLRKILEKVYWGNSLPVESLSLDDVKTYLKKLLESKSIKTIKVGVAQKLSIPNSTKHRIYIGVFDNAWKCIAATQLLVDNIDVDLAQKFLEKDVIIFSDGNTDKI